MTPSHIFLNRQTGYVDYDKLEEKALEYRPKVSGTQRATRLGHDIGMTDYHLRHPR